MSILIAVTEETNRQGTNNTPIPKLYGVPSINLVKDNGTSATIILNGKRENEERIVSETYSAIKALLGEGYIDFLLSVTEIDGTLLLLRASQIVEIQENSDSKSIITFRDKEKVQDNKYIVDETLAQIVALIPIPGAGEYVPISGGVMTGNLEVGAQAFSSLPSALVPTGTTQTIDWDDGNGQVLDLDSATGDVTLTLDNPNEGATYIIKVEQGGTTPRDLIYPANVLWANGMIPVITTGLDSEDLLVLFYDGTNYLASFNQNYS